MSALQNWVDQGNKLSHHDLRRISRTLLKSKLYHHALEAVINPDYPILSVDDLANQIAEVLNFFGFSAVMCMGVTAGAYILTLFAMKYKQHVLGLILVSPLCKEPSWTELVYIKVMSNLLYFYGMCGVVKEILLKQYFSKEIRGGTQSPESDIVKACQRLSQYYLGE